MGEGYGMEGQDGEGEERVVRIGMKGVVIVDRNTDWMYNQYMFVSV